MERILCTLVLAEHALSRTAKKLLERTNLTTEDIDYINLHGTATVAGDAYETAEIRELFGEKAKTISTSATKSMTGHMLGASGAVEAIATLLAIDEGFIPPTIGLSQADPACDLNYTPETSIEKPIRHALSWSMGFGGHVAAIVFKKVD